MSRVVGDSRPESFVRAHVLGFSASNSMAELWVRLHTWTILFYA